ncbi:MAG: hypothetical protein KBE41_04900 [Lutibacter sp.]|nr:hypothetical protein [Lutibacter sp.]MBP9600822.1 hypothetical protein [Lutibacter sp.]
MTKKLNIVSFDVPYPPNYGGVIDVFYKIKELHFLGIEIYLHTFDNGRGIQNELLKYCKKVTYYKRKSNFSKLISTLPYVVKTRDNQKLINNLSVNNSPILFEGIHTTFPLLNSNLKNRKIFIRAHNIEHHYYEGLYKSEKNIFKKIFFKLESYKLKKYEFILNNADCVFSISPADQAYFSTIFKSKSVYIPAFHSNSTINSKLGRGNYAIYNGDLRVADNVKSCEFLINIFSEIEFPLIISSSFENNFILKECKKHTNITYLVVSKKKEIDALLQDAHINLLPTFQNTGIKLKLINALYNSRFCIANNAMIKNTGVENLCLIANSKSEFTVIINKLITQNFTVEFINERKKTLSIFENQLNALKIANLL